MHSEATNATPFMDVFRHAALRGQTAIVRALLDHLEAALDRGEPHAREQIAEELKRLGYKVLEAAAMLSANVDDDGEPPESGVCETVKP